VGFAALTTWQSLYPQKLALTSPTGGGRSVGIVRSWTKAMDFSFSHIFHFNRSINFEWAILGLYHYCIQYAISKEITGKC
jgi:hypothetical protein